MVEVEVGEREYLDNALRRFRRKVIRAGIFKDLRRKRHYVKPSVAKKEKIKAAKKRNAKEKRRAAQGRETF